MSAFRPSSVRKKLAFALLAAASRSAPARSKQVADFLDIEKYPTITFKSTKVEANKDGSEAKIYGDLTIKDVTKPVVLQAEFLGQGKSPFGTTVAGFSGKTKIDRENFGLTWNMALEAGGWLVGKDVNIELDVEAVLATEAAPA